MKTVLDISYLNGALVIKYSDNTVEMYRTTGVVTLNDPMNIIFGFVNEKVRGIKAPDVNVLEEKIKNLQETYKDFFTRYTGYSEATYAELQVLLGNLHLHLFP